MAAITRDQVREAIRRSNCDVPDFTTRKKMSFLTNLFASKIYVSYQNDQLRFVELNFLQKFFRCICFTRWWYDNTIFAEKDTLKKVKQIVHGIKAEPFYHDRIAMDLLPEAKTKTDFTCIHDMLSKCPVENDEVKADIEGLMVSVKRSLLSLHEENGFSEGFLSSAIALAKANYKKNPRDTMWESISNGFETSADHEVNKPLLREIMGLPNRNYFPSLQIEVADEIQTLVGVGIEKANEALETMHYWSSLKDYMKACAEIEKVSGDLNNLKEVIRPFLSQESGKEMVQNLRKKLIDSKAHPGIVKMYIEDEQQIVYRLFHQADFYDIKGRKYKTACQEVENWVGVFKRSMLTEFANYYRVDDVGDKDSFSASCNKHLADPDYNCRVKIAAELKKDQYRAFIEARIKADEIPPRTYEEYCQWIIDPKAPVGLPELMAFSHMMKCPLIVVQKKGFEFDWINGINFDFDGFPLIFNCDKNGHWSPVYKK